MPDTDACRSEHEHPETAPVCKWFRSVFIATVLCVMHTQVLGDSGCSEVVDIGGMTALVAAMFSDPQNGCAAMDVNYDDEISAADIVAATPVVSAPPRGPTVTFLGVAGADGTAVSPLGLTAGRPLFVRPFGSGFQIVVEGRTGQSGQPPGLKRFNSSLHDASRRPDLQIETSESLGDGSPAVCDGGVPGIYPPDFGPSQRVSNTLNDLACHAVVATSPAIACTQDQYGNSVFRAANTQVQFCLQVSKALEFSVGETIVSVRLRDTAGNLGPLRQIVIRVGSGSVPPTSTARPTSTAPPTATHTRTPTVAIPTRTPSASSTAQRATPSPPPSPSVTASLRPTETQAPGSTPTATAFALGTPSPTAASPTSTRAPSETPVRSATPSGTTTCSPTPTPTIAIGPVITFFGVTRGDDTLVSPSGATVDGTTVYSRPAASGFSLVVEGRPGSSGASVGRSTYQPDLTSFPDLQIEASRPLGNGSPAVCDRTGRTAGGVPAIDPPNFDETQINVDIVNDFACRFLDGSGAPVGRGGTEACVLFPDGNYGFVGAASRIQFCAVIDRVVEFPLGDTLVTARLRDVNGNPGPSSQLVIRVGPEVSAMWNAANP